jgi:type IV secretion system protein VirD4
MYNQIDLFRPTLPKTFGSAEWVTMSHLRKSKMLTALEGKDLGPIISCLTPAEIGGREIHNVYANGQGHLLSVAPTSAGKSHGQLISSLLSWPGSAIVLDIKGEAFRHSAGWRQSQGHRIIRFAPFEQDSAMWNPFDHINDGCGPEPIAANHPARQENVEYVAELGIVPNPNSKEPYWDNSSKSRLEGMILHVATADLALVEEDRKDLSRVRERTMGEVRRLLLLDGASQKQLIGNMASSNEDLVREAASTMNQMQPAREQSASVQTVLLEHTKIWGYRRIKNVTARSTFSFRELRGSTPTTIYLLIPPKYVRKYRSLLRILIGCCMRELEDSWEQNDKKNPVLFLLDEFPQLAYMQPIEDALLYIRSYGVKFWFFVQDMSQLRCHYEMTWQQFVANCATRMFFGVSDIETAKVVSEMTGQATVRNRSYAAGFNESDTIGETTTTGHSSQSGSGGSSSGSFSSRSFSTSRTRGSSFTSNLAYVGRPLLMPDEVLRMPFGSMIILIKGMPAIRGQIRFWREWKLREGMMLPPAPMIEER